MNTLHRFVNHDEAFRRYYLDKNSENLFWLCIGLNAGGMWRTARRVIAKNKVGLAEYFIDAPKLDRIEFNDPFLVNCYCIAYSHFYGIQLNETNPRLGNVIPDVETANQFVDQLKFSSARKVAFDEEYFLDRLRDSYPSFSLDWAIINSEYFANFEDLTHDQLLLCLHLKICQGKCNPELINHFYDKFRYSVQFYSLSRNFYGSKFCYFHKFVRRWLEIAIHAPY